MGLFGSSKPDVTTSRKVRPTVVITQNVPKELQKLARSYEINADTLDFNILEIKTYTRINSADHEGEWEEIYAEELYELDDKTALLNQYFQIKQVYEVEIFSKNRDENQFSDFKLAIGANSTKCKIYLSILAGSHVEYTSRLEQELLTMINKRKIRSGVLINIFDEMLSDVVSKIAARVRVAEKLDYSDNERFLIAESYEPTLTINDALILHYDKKNDVDENEKIDYAARGFIKSVHHDELLIEYVKPKIGKPGRSCRGEYISAKEPTVTNEPKFNVDDTIKVVETATNIQYIATVNGYISLSSNIYSIQTDVDLKQISFKSTGSIATGIHSDVSINVKEKDAIKDAIGKGMEVEVSEIDVDGNVGSNAKVIALRANISGQTHKTAMVKADKLTINIHKGMAYGKHIHIARLEHGVVDGNIVEIEEAVGGKINAKEITIEVCGSNVSATASKLIEIDKLVGSENSFTISPLVKKSAKQGLDENNESIHNLESDIKELKKEIVKTQKLIKDSTASYNDIKRRLINYKKNNIKMPESFVKKYKEFLTMQDALEESKKQLVLKNDRYTLLTTEAASFQDNIFDARIINRHRWIGRNELKFVLVDPPREILFYPQENSADKIFGLVQVDENEYEIQAMNDE